MELWSSVLSKDFQLRRKTCFLVLVLVCITVAATAGPSSASLLIARQGLWPIAPTYIALNTTVLDLWPDRIDGTKVESDCAVVRLVPQDDAPRCPISESLGVLAEAREIIESDPEFMSIIPFFEDPEDSFSRFLSLSKCDTSIKDQMCATIPQNAIVPGFLSVLMNQAGSWDDVDGYRALQKDYYQPYTIASCLTDSVKDASDQAPLRFPRISETDSELKKDREIFSIPGLTKGQMISRLSEDDSDFHVDWIDLPKDVFRTGIPGAVIVNSQTPKYLMRNITTCTLNAGWGSSTIMSMSQEPGATYSHMSNVPSSWTANKASEDTNGYIFYGMPNFANISNFSYPQRRISISKNWMEFLNPSVIQPNNSTGNFISLLLSSLQTQTTESFQPTEINMAMMLNSILSVGLSGIGTVDDWEGIYEQS